jgi:hypothetical protein
MFVGLDTGDLTVIKTYADRGWMIGYELGHGMDMW